MVQGFNFRVLGVRFVFFLVIIGQNMKQVYGISTHELPP